MAEDMPKLSEVSLEDIVGPDVAEEVREVADHAQPADAKEAEMVDGLTHMLLTMIRDGTGSPSYLVEIDEKVAKELKAFEELGVFGQEVRNANEALHLVFMMMDSSRPDLAHNGSVPEPERQKTQPELQGRKEPKILTHVEAPDGFV